jgi:quercetin dioxygenase-like cupin family protein
MTDASADALAFDKHLDATAPAVADIARALRRTVLDGFPAAVELFDAADGLLAIGTGRSMRDFVFAIIPHKSWVNLQLVDGVDLPNPDGRIEGTGKRIRHVKVRSVEDAGAPWVRAVVAAQVALRATPAEQTSRDTTGVTSTVLKTIDLGPEILGMEGRQLRMRMVTIEPGGAVGPTHDHIGRPGVVYVLQGTVTDHRDGVDTEYGPGLGWPEDRNTLHWVENNGTIPAVEISIDIVKKETAG